MNCKNCDHPFEGKFCQHCGQKGNVRRLSLVAVMSDFLFAITDTEQGLLRTIVDLSRNPGDMVNSYLGGRRKRYLSAAKYLLLMVVVFTIDLNLLESHYGMFERLTQKLRSGQDTVTIALNHEEAAVKPADDSKKSQPDTVTFDFMGKKKTVTKVRLMEFIVGLVPVYHRMFFDYLRVFALLWLPIFSILSLMFYFRSGKNLAEHFTFNTYIFSHMLFFFVAMSPLYWFLPKLSWLTLQLTLGIMVFYLVFAYMQFFGRENRRLMKLGSVLVLGLSGFTTLVVTLCACLALYVGYLNLDQI